MSLLWTGLVSVAVIVSLLQGTTEEITLASLDGAKKGVELCISMGGGICLWMGVLEVMKQSGLAEKVAWMLNPLLKWLYPSESGKAHGYIANNVSANLLGLGNAATPLGLKAAQEIVKGGNYHALYKLIVCNTASITLIPTTVATLRMAEGCTTPFDILPCVWFSSLVALVVGLGLCGCFEKGWHIK